MRIAQVIITWDQVVNVFNLTYIFGEFLKQPENKTTSGKGLIFA
jgi:hypothetical protein